MFIRHKHQIHEWASLAIINPERAGKPPEPHWYALHVLLATTTTDNTVRLLVRSGLTAEEVVLAAAGKHGTDYESAVIAAAILTPYTCNTFDERFRWVWELFAMFELSNDEVDSISYFLKHLAVWPLRYKRYGAATNRAEIVNGPASSLTGPTVTG